MKKRVLSLFMAFVLCLTLLPAPALAEEAGTEEAVGTTPTQSVEYYDGKTGERSNAYCVTLDTSITTWDQDWYYARGSITIEGGATAEKSVNLVLADGATLTVKGGLTLSNNATLTIYAVSADNSDGLGKLSVKNDNGYAVSGSGTVDLCSGKLYAYSGTGRALEQGISLTSGGGSREHLLTRLRDCRPSSPSTKLEEWWEKDIALSWFQLEPCKHSSYEAVKTDDSHHRYICPDCGDIMTKDGVIVEDACTFETNDREYVAPKEPVTGGHYLLCDELCGNVSTNVYKHDITCMPTDDGKWHTQRCLVCLYTPTENNPETKHVYEESEDGSCDNCGFQPVAYDADGNLYGSVTKALNAVADSGTVTLEAKTGSKELSEEVVFNCAGKSVTLNMNGYTLTARSNTPLTVKNGTLTVTGDAIIKNTGTYESAASAVVLTGGKLIFNGALTAHGGTYANGNFKEQKPAVYAEGGELEFNGNLDLQGGLKITADAKLTKGLTQGAFSVDTGVQNTTRLSVEGAKNYDYLRDLLADGYAFYDGDSKRYLVFSETFWSGDVTIVEHEHDWTREISDGSHSCECGRSESHKYGSDGKCSVCGYECQHTTVDYDGTCLTCNVKMAVRIENGSSTTYSTDFKTAMYNATNGTKITLLTDVSISGRTGISGDNTTVTLDLNGHKITSGWIDVGDKDSNETYTTCTLKIIGKGSYEPPTYGGIITVDVKATLDLSEWKGGTISEISIADNSEVEQDNPSVREAGVIVGTEAGTIGKLGFWNNQLDELKKTKLSGGSYGEIYVGDHLPVKLSDLLVSGYALQYENGSYEKYTTTLKKASICNVSVVKCPHNGLTVDQETHKGTCAYCGMTGEFVASVDGDTYKEWGNAFSAWLANGGTLKLYTDYTAADGTWHIGSGSHTIDLNGHKMSVENDGAFKPTNNMHLTIIDSKAGDGTGKITSILLDGKEYGSLTLESGHIDNLEAIDYSGGLSIRGGSVGNLDVKTWSDGAILSITGGSIDDLKIQEWPEGKIVSIEGGSIGKYSLPKGRVLADVISVWGYNRIGSNANLTASSRTETSEITFSPVSVNLGPGSKSGYISFGGNVPLAPMTDMTSPYSVLWYRRTEDGVQLMEEVTLENREVKTKTLKDDAFKDVKVGETLEDVFCVIQVTENGSDTWQTAITGYTLTVTKADLSDATITIENADTLVYSGQPLTPEVKVAYNGKELTEGTDYTISGKTSGIDAGEYTLTVKAVNDSNYMGEKDKVWRIAPHTLSGPNTNSHITKQYDGTTTLPDGIITSVFASRVNLGSAVTLEPGTDYTVLKKSYTDPNVGQEKEIYYKIKLLNPNYRFLNGGDEMDFYETALFAITKATMESDTMTADKAFTIVNKLSKTYEIDLAQYLPTLPDGCEYGEVSYSDLAVVLPSQYYSGGAPGAPVAEIKDGKVILPILKNGETTTGKVGTVQLTVSSINYENFALSIEVSAINKLVPTGAPTLSRTTLTYGEPLSAITLSGAMKNGAAEVEGTFAWTAPETVPDAGTYQAAWRFTPADSSTYDEVTGTVTVTIEKATPTGAPKYTAITASGRTLADAGLTVEGGTFSVAGTVQWVDKDGNALPDDTVVEANMTYKWKFAPTDINNYNTLEDSIKLYSVSTGGGGGAVTPPTTTETETTTDPDGTTTKTETKSDGSTVETVTKPDGSTTTTETKTETKPDGSTTTTETKSETNADGSKTETKSETTTAADGTKTETKSETKTEADGTKSETKAETKTDANGVTSGTETTQTTTPNGSTGTTTTTTENGNTKTEAEAKISEKAVEDAKQSGEAVKVPTEVKAGENSNSAPTVKVELPKDAGETKIEIPVSDVNSGTVAVIVHEDGTEEIVKDSTVTENGVVLGVEGNATVKIIDNSKDFHDTRDHWSRDEVNFVASRELFNGVGGSSFGVNEPMTRGMVNTVLARLAGIDTTTSGGSKWYEAGTAWAKDNGISDGTNPTANVTREQLAAMLYRFAGSPEVSGELGFADADHVSGYAKNALLWAVQNGILNGIGDNLVAPKNSAERAQVAAMMARYLKNL